MGNELQKISGAIESQLEKTDEVIASNEAVADMVSEVNNAISEVNNTLTSGFTMLGAGLQELCFITEDGFREVIDRLDIQNKTLEAIRVILEGPLDTQAKELRKRGDVAYVNGWLDEAESDLLEAEKKNYQDFITYYILGNVYYKKKNYQKALEYYQKSVKYATIESKEYVYHASKALLRAGMVYYEIGQLSEAYKSTKLAIELTPQDSHILYNHARYAAKMRRIDEFKRCLSVSISMDPSYLIAADTDEMLFEVKNEVKDLAEKKRDIKRKEVEGIIKEIESDRKEAESLGINDFTSLDKQLVEINKLCARNSYFDFLKAEPLARKAYKEGMEEWIKVKDASIKELKIEEDRVKGSGIYAFWGFLLAIVVGILITAIIGFNPDWVRPRKVGPTKILTVTTYKRFEISPGLKIGNHAYRIGETLEVLDETEDMICIRSKAGEKECYGKEGILFYAKLGTGYAYDYSRVLSGGLLAFWFLGFPVIIWVLSAWILKQNRLDVVKNKIQIENTAITKLKLKQFEHGC